jgi:nucleotide-binding universal stress UspA family protein
MKKILVPTDFSDCAENAAKTAAQIAKKTGAEIFLLHILHIPSYDTNSGITESQDIPEGLFLMKLAQKKFAELTAQPFFEGIKVIEAIQFDNTYEGIAKKAEEHDIDLIVMGTHGISGWKEAFVGSNTERVIRLADCPVLTVKENLDVANLNNIVFASNFYGEVGTMFEPVKAFAELFDSKIHLLKIVVPGGFERTARSNKIMQDFAEKFELENYTINVYNDETVEEGVSSFANSISADLIAMPTHGHKGLKHLLWGSRAEDLANHSSQPVLTMKIHQPEIEYGVIFPTNN